ncbi:c-type cytochrome [Alteraurantiacibacter palmitatis]|uniref:C-type cytochrome n=1 Tax=Alteraurantiacibacter palmitatis TaxID=2054628 RepID=A0ABV7EA64_9SPHN
MRPAGFAALAGAAGAVMGVATASTSAQDSAGNVSSVAIAEEGAGVYVQICQACHMADARGGAGAGTGIPALADNPRMADKDYAIEIMIKGRGGMPWFSDILSSRQIAAVLTHIRTNFNDYEEPITALEVDRAIALAGGPVSDE